MWCVQEKTADPGTARAAIVFANEYMHIDDVVLGANSLGLYQLVEMGKTQTTWDRAPGRGTRRGIRGGLSALVLTAVGFLCAGLKPARAAMDSVTRNKATETVKYILDRRGDLRQRPKVLQKLPPPDTESFLGKLGAVEQPLGTTVQEQVRATGRFFLRRGNLPNCLRLGSFWRLSCHDSSCCDPS